MTGSSSKSAKDDQQQAQPAENPPARLCYVDDSRTSAYVVKRLLRPYGYIVDHFNSAEPALIALVKNKYDLLLTDLKVSPTGMDGDDLVRALRNSGHEKISALPVIVITGATDEAVLREVYEAGANQILSKPVNGDELDTHIRNLVHGESLAAGDSAKIMPGSASGSESSTGVKMSAPAAAVPSATVVPFEPEALSVKSQTLADLDNIPVLNSADSAKSAKDTVEDRLDSHAPSHKLGATRRILNARDAAANNDKITPQPIISVKPASRVTPTINLSNSAATAVEAPPTEPKLPAASKAKSSVGRKRSIEKIQAEIRY